MSVISLTCWHCARRVEVNEYALTTVNDVLNHARRAKMIVKDDPRNGRVLVFCGQRCASENMTDEGYRIAAPAAGYRGGRIISSVYLRGR